MATARRYCGTVRIELDYSNFGGGYYNARLVTMAGVGATIDVTSIKVPPQAKSDPTSPLAFDAVASIAALKAKEYGWKGQSQLGSSVSRQAPKLSAPQKKERRKHYMTERQFKRAIGEEELTRESTRKRGKR